MLEIGKKKYERKRHGQHYVNARFQFRMRKIIINYLRNEIRYARCNCNCLSQTP